MGKSIHGRNLYNWGIVTIYTIRGYLGLHSKYLSFDTYQSYRGSIACQMTVLDIIKKFIILRTTETLFNPNFERLFLLMFS